MSDENKNKENIKQQNQNKKKLCKKMFYLNKKHKLLFIFILFLIICFLFYFNNTKKNNAINNSDCFIHKKISRMNISRSSPFLIKLKNGKILIFGGEDIIKYKYNYTYPELFNPKTKKYKKLKELNYQLDVTYYEFKNGNLLFFSDNKIILYNLKEEKFYEYADSIPELVNTKRKACFRTFLPQIIPYSDEYIYISTFGTKSDGYPAITREGILDNKENLEWIIKYNLNTKKYVKIKPPNVNLSFIGSIVISNKELLCISSIENEIYIYNVEKNKFEKKGKLPINDYFFGLSKIGNDTICALPYSNNFFQFIDLNTYKVKTNQSKHFLTKYTGNEWAATNDFILFHWGNAFNKNATKFGIFWEKPSGSIISLDNNTFLRVGDFYHLTSPSTYSEIVQLKEKRKL